MKHGYFLPAVEIKDYKTDDGKNFSDRPIGKMEGSCNNLSKIMADQGDDYSTRCLLGYPYFKENDK